MSTTRLSRASKEYRTRVASAFRLAQIALRVAGLEEDSETAIIKKTPGKGYCVKSEKNSDWSGGCYPSKNEAEERLDDVEMFKHMEKKSGGRLLTREDLLKFVR